MPFVYRTELMDQILTSSQARRIIEYMTPIYGAARTMLWLIQSVGTALDIERELVDDYIKQIFPQTATWSIGLWEKGFGTKPEEWWTLEQRRRAVIDHENPNAPMGPKRLSDIASNAAGVWVEIIEGTGEHQFDVAFHEDPDNPARHKEDAYNVIDQCKPAHMIYKSGIEVKPVSSVNEALFLLSALTVMVRADNFALLSSWFDGWRKFNGAFRFGIAERKGLHLRAIECLFGNRNLFNQSLVLERMATAKASYGSAWAISLLVAGDNPALAVPQFVVETGTCSPSRAKVIATTDTRWYFDQTFRFDGTRRFNAEIKKEEF